jgi:hypothetical protein
MLESWTLGSWWLESAAKSTARKKKNRLAPAFFRFQKESKEILDRSLLWAPATAQRILQALIEPGSSSRPRTATLEYLLSTPVTLRR